MVGVNLDRLFIFYFYLFLDPSLAKRATFFVYKRHVKLLKHPLKKTITLSEGHFLRITYEGWKQFDLFKKNSEDFEESSEKSSFKFPADIFQTFEVSPKSSEFFGPSESFRASSKKGSGENLTSLDLSKWEAFSRKKSKEVLLCVLWSFLFKVPENISASFLGMSVGTLQSNLSQCLKELGGSSV